jgi:hypothetical protein
MACANITVDVSLDASEFLAFSSELDVYLERLGELPAGIRKLALAFLDGTAEFACLENRAAPVGAVLVSLKPSNFVLDFLAACRALDR